jgi:hypothetical protein
VPALAAVEGHLGDLRQPGVGQPKDGSDLGQVAELPDGIWPGDEPVADRGKPVETLLRQPDTVLIEGVLQRLATQLTIRAPRPPA